MSCFSVRPAEFRDIGDLLSMSKSFLAAQPLDLPFSEIWVQRSIEAHMTSRLGFVWVIEREGSATGFLWACASESLVAPVMVSQEIALWIDPGTRGDLRAVRELVDAYRKWAVANEVTVIGLAAFVGGKTASAFQRWGWDPVETHFIART